MLYYPKGAMEMFRITRKQLFLLISGCLIVGVLVGVAAFKVFTGKESRTSGEEPVSGASEAIDVTHETTPPVSEEKNDDSSADEERLQEKTNLEPDPSTQLQEEENTVPNVKASSHEIDTADTAASSSSIFWHSPQSSENSSDINTQTDDVNPDAAAAEPDTAMESGEQTAEENTYEEGSDSEIIELPEIFFN